MTPALEAIFGNRTAALVLMFIEAYGEGHAKRIADTFDMGLSMTQRQLQRLEANSVLESRKIGNIRLYAFNQSNKTAQNLRGFLKLELDLLPESEVKKYFRQRQRPRRTGKEL